MSTNALVSVDYRPASPQLPFRRVITLPGPDGPTLLRAASGRIAVTEDAVPWAVSHQRPLTVIDLRRGAEIWHRPAGGSPQDLQVLPMPLHDPRFAALPWAEHTAGAFRRHYRSLARRALPQVDAALDALASGRDVLITCQLGRDRTAIVVAGVLARLGTVPQVTRDDGDLTYRELALRPQWLSRVLAERGETLDGFLLRNQAAHAAFHDLFDGDTPVALRSVAALPGGSALSGELSAVGDAAEADEHRGAADLEEQGVLESGGSAAAGGRRPGGHRGGRRGRGGRGGGGRRRGEDRR